LDRCQCTVAWFVQSRCDFVIMCPSHVRHANPPSSQLLIAFRNGRAGLQQTINSLLSSPVLAPKHEFDDIVTLVSSSAVQHILVCY
jgi:hypothetical protein